MLFIAQVEAAVNAAEKAYGPYAFGLVAVLVILGAILIVYTKAVKPTQEAAVKVAVEQTKQTENLRLTASHTETALAIAREVGKQNENAREILHSMISKV